MEPPKESRQIEYDLGGEETIPIIIKKYSCKVEIPLPLSPKSLIAENGIAGETAISDEGLFIAEMNSDATTLLTVRDDQNDYYMALFPKSEMIIQENPIIGAKSTAVSLVAFQAGLVTGEPEIDALILAILDTMPAVQELANQIECEIASRSFDLKNSFSPSMLMAMQMALEDINYLSIDDVLSYNLVQKTQHFIKTKIASIGPATALAWPVDNNCSENLADNLFDVDGIDKDGICLTGTIRETKEPSKLRMENTLGRWVLLALDEDSDVNWIDCVPPRNVQIPGIEGVLTDLLSLAWAGSKDFLNNIFWHKDGSSVEEKIEEILEGYFGNTVSSKNFAFQDEGEHTLFTLGAHKSMFSEPHQLETGTSFLLGSVTEVIIPWISVVLEIKGTAVIEDVQQSISKSACKDRIKEFIKPSLSMIQNVFETHATQGLGGAMKNFGTNFVQDLLLKEEGLLVIACLTKVKLDWRAVKKAVLYKLAKYIGTGSVGFWVDLINKGVSTFNAASSTLLFVDSMFDDSIEPIDRYTVIVAPEALSGCGAYIAPGVWKDFDCYNLAAVGKTTGDDPFTPSWRLIGGYWRWGRKGPNSSQWYDTNTIDFIHGPTGPEPDDANSHGASEWVTTWPAPDGSWSDLNKTANDPCPSGYRVPTLSEWDGVQDNNNSREVGTTWPGGTFTNYDHAIFFGDNLMLPTAGFHYKQYGQFIYHGYGHYWSSTDYPNDNAGYFSTGAADSSYRYGARRNGLSVRCIKDN